MHHSFRITKYKDVDENGNLYSSSGEWTSYLDIGKMVSLVEYERTENEYISFIFSVCQFFNVDSLKINELEIMDDDVEMTDESVITLENISQVIKNILREKIWCKLVCDQFEFHFGYDFYMYVVSNDSNSLTRCIESITSTLTIQEHLSPY